MSHDSVMEVLFILSVVAIPFVVAAFGLVGIFVFAYWKKLGEPKHVKKD